MSNRMTPDAAGSNSSVQPVAASRASVAELTISSSRPASSAMRAQNACAVLGGAADFGRNQPRAPDLARVHLVAADQERIDRARDRRLADAARGGKALAEANDAGEGIDHAEAVRGRPRDQQAAIVGAEIERRIGRLRRPRKCVRGHRRDGNHRDACRTAFDGPSGAARAGPIAVEAALRRPRRPCKTFPPRRSVPARRRGPCSSLNRVEMYQQYPSGQYCAFLA